LMGVFYWMEFNLKPLLNLGFKQIERMTRNSFYFFTGLANCEIAGYLQLRKSINSI